MLVRKTFCKKYFPMTVCAGYLKRQCALCPKADTVLVLHCDVCGDEIIHPETESVTRNDRDFHRTCLKKEDTSHNGIQ